MPVEVGLVRGVERRVDLRELPLTLRDVVVARLVVRLAPLLVNQLHFRQINTVVVWLQNLLELKPTQISLC